MIGIGLLPSVKVEGVVISKKDINKEEKEINKYKEKSGDIDFSLNIKDDK